MKIVLYAQALDMLEHLERRLSQMAYRVAEELADISDALVICALENDVRGNDTIIRFLVGRNNRMLILQRVPSIEPARHYLSLGVHGYGNVMMDELFFLSALQALQSNMMWIHPEITSKMVALLTPTYTDVSFLEKLTIREQEIALLLLEGKLYSEIATMLEITPRMVKAHATHIYQKLQVKDRLDFALHYK